MVLKTLQEKKIPLSKVGARIREININQLELLINITKV